MITLEIFAVLTALLYIFFAIKEKAICFIFGLISSAIYVLICFQTGFYFDMAINSYYILMSAYGLLLWNKKESHKSPNINVLGNKERAIYLSMGIFGTAILGYIGQNYLNSSLPYMDAFTTCFAAIATWMVVKKHIENWLVWIVVDAVAVYMYYQKELNYTAILFMVYVVLAFMGFLSWKRKMVL